VWIVNTCPCQSFGEAVAISELERRNVWGVKKRGTWITPGELKILPPSLGIKDHDILAAMRWSKEKIYNTESRNEKRLWGR
jgi:hypothetical protein